MSADSALRCTTPSQILTERDREFLEALSKAKYDQALALLDQGINPDARDEPGTLQCALWLAQSSYNYDNTHGHREVFDRLIALGANPNVLYRERPLLAMVAQLFPWDVARWVAAGADIEARDEKGMTAFMHQVLRGEILGTQALLEAGADLFAQDDRGWRARDHAAARGGLVLSWYQQTVGPMELSITLGQTLDGGTDRPRRRF